MGHLWPVRYQFIPPSSPGVNCRKSYHLFCSCLFVCLFGASWGRVLWLFFYFYFVTKVKMLSNLPEATQLLKPLYLSPKLPLLMPPELYPRR